MLGAGELGGLLADPVLAGAAREQEAVEELLAEGLRQDLPVRLVELGVAVDVVEERLGPREISLEHAPQALDAVGLGDLPQRLVEEAVVVVHPGQRGGVHEGLVAVAVELGEPHLHEGVQELRRLGLLRDHLLEGLEPADDLVEADELELGLEQACHAAGVGAHGRGAVPLLEHEVLGRLEEVALGAGRLEGVAAGLGLLALQHPRIAQPLGRLEVAERLLLALDALQEEGDAVLELLSGLVAQVVEGLHEGLL